MSLLTRWDLALAAEAIAFAKEHPNVTAFYRWIVARRVLVLAVVALARGLLDAMGVVNDDARLFADAGSRLLSAGALDVFADSRVQVGPLLLLPFGLVALGAKAVGLPVIAVISASIAVTFTIAVLFVLRFAASSEGKRVTEGMELFVGLWIVLGGFTWTASTSGHPAEGFIPLLWILSAVMMRSSRPVVAGLLLGGAAGMKIWGVLGFPLLLLDRDSRSALKATLAAAGSTIAVYAPFPLFGRVATLDYSWAVKPQSPLAWVLSPGADFSWWMRLAQTVLIVGGSFPLLPMMRKSPQAVWLYPLTIVTIRLLLDPLDYHYYWLPMGVSALVGFALSMNPAPSWSRVLVGPGYYLTIAPFFLMKGVMLRAWITFICGFVLLWVLRFGIRAENSNKRGKLE